jgi:large subunit ribosomal protein L32e
MYKGWPPAAGAGYGGPRVSRGLHPSGYREVLVHNAEQLERVNPKTQAIRIAHTVGKKNRGDLLAEARRKKITILNLGQASEALARKPEEAEEEKEEATETEKETKEPQKAPEEEKSKVEEKPKKRKGRSKKQ